MELRKFIDVLILNILNEILIKFAKDDIPRKLSMFQSVSEERPDDFPKLNQTSVIMV